MSTHTDDDCTDEPTVTITVQAADEHTLERLQDGYAAAAAKDRAPALADYLLNAARVQEVQVQGPDGEAVPSPGPGED